MTGPPGVGKTTYAEAYAAQHGGVHVPMDGFHLADRVLAARGLLDRKGAPETFDARGYAALLARLHEEAGPAGHVVYAPAFERDLEQPLAGAIAVPPECELVVTEGNYLLLDEPQWRAVRSHCDEVVYLECDEGLRRERLVARHVASAKTVAAAESWVRRVDEPNAVLVRASRGRADRVVHV